MEPNDVTICREQERLWEGTPNMSKMGLLQIVQHPLNMMKHVVPV